MQCQLHTVIIALISITFTLQLHIHGKIRANNYVHLSSIMKMILGWMCFNPAVSNSALHCCLLCIYGYHYASSVHVLQNKASTAKVYVNLFNLDDPSVIYYIYYITSNHHNIEPKLLNALLH